MSPSGDTTGAEPQHISLSLARAELEAIREHCEAGYTEEVCGGLLGRRVAEGSLEIVATVSVANERRDQRTRRYLIGPDDVVSLERLAHGRGLQLMGYYHSHPDAPAQPSDFDRQHAWPWYVYVIVSVTDGVAVEARAWRLAEDRSRFTPVSINGSESISFKVD